MSLGRYCITVRQSLSGRMQEYFALYFYGMVHGNCRQDWQLPLVQLPMKGWTRLSFEVPSNLYDAAYFPGAQ